MSGNGSAGRAVNQKPGKNFVVGLFDKMIPESIPKFSTGKLNGKKYYGRK
jgi:hypothetical protein